MKTRLDLVQGWIRKAESDLTNVRLCVSHKASLDTACFHAQQALEKALKSILARCGERIPRIHDLRLLTNLAVQTDGYLMPHKEKISDITDWAVATRYPGDYHVPFLDELQSGLALTEILCDLISENSGK